MNIEILSGSEANLELLLPLFDAYRVFYRKAPELAAAKDFLRERLRKKESEIFIAKWEGRTAGFVQLYPLFSSTRMKRLWLLNDLYVSPEFRRKGISLALIVRCKKLCEETRACGLILETEKSNAAGRILYPKAGFKIDEYHDYYSWEPEG